MEHKLSRRNFVWTVAGAAMAKPLLGMQQRPAPPSPAIGTAGRSAVALIKGEDRRKNIYNSLLAIEEQLQKGLQSKKYVVIKPNFVNTVNQLASTHADAMRGILDFLAPRFKGPIVIAESAAGNTLDGFANFGFDKLVSEYKPRDVQLIDLNSEGKYKILPVVDADLHPVPVRLAARLLDPDAFIICSGVMKTHNVVVATLSVKNMALGAPLRSAPKEKPRWNDKRKYHGGVRQTHLDIMLTAQKLAPFWGAAVIDGFEGMEGNGPNSGEPVPSRLAIASTDFIAADRVGLEVMGIDPEWVGYLNFCSQYGVGQFDMAKIDVLGETPAKVMKKYQLHQDIDRELQWRGPMTELPPRLG